MKKNNNRLTRLKKKDQIINTVIEQLSELLDYGNISGPNRDAVKNVDLEKGTITIEFKFYEVKEDNYIGLAAY